VNTWDGFPRESEDGVVTFISTRLFEEYGRKTNLQVVMVLSTT